MHFPFTAMIRSPFCTYIDIEFTSLMSCTTMIFIPAKMINRHNIETYGYLYR